MSKHLERLTTFCKNPCHLRIALDLLEGLVPPHREELDHFVAGFENAPSDVENLVTWCAERLTPEQVHWLLKALRLAANHQRVYKRTVMLSPRAHLMVKALSERDGMRMSDVVEVYLDAALRLEAGLRVRTTVQLPQGQVDNEVVPCAEPPFARCVPIGNDIPR